MFSSTHSTNPVSALKINLSRLLEAFGVNIPDEKGSVNGNGDLSGENQTTRVRCRCPLHASEDESMEAAVNPSTGDAFFRCIDPKCGFSGDAVSLAAKKFGYPEKDAILLFRPGGKLAETLDEPLHEDEIKAWEDNAFAQKQIRAYLVNCRRALLRTPEKCHLRPGLSQMNLRLIPDDLGLLVQDEAMPRCLWEFRKPRYRKSVLLVFPHVYNGDVTHIDVYDAEAPATKYVANVSRPDLGMFLGRFEEPPTRLFVAASPMAAAKIYASAAVTSAKRPPIVSVSGYPISDEFRGIKSLWFISTPDEPISISDTLAAMTAPFVVPGETEPPALKVWNCEKRSCEVTANDLRFRENANLTDVGDWTIGKMADLIARGQSDVVSDALRRNPLPEFMRKALLYFAQSKAKEKQASAGNTNPYAALCDMLSGSPSLSSDDLVLGNGHVLKREATRLSALQIRGGVDILANVGLVVDSKIVSYDGNEVLCCTVTPSDAQTAPAKVSLPESCWDSPGRIQKIVSKAFAARGQSPYIAFYEVSGYKWRDILSKLSEHCQLSREVNELGIDDVSDIHLPEFIVKSDGTIERQDRVFTIPECSLRAYAGIPFNEDPAPTDAFKSCLANCDNLYVAAFTLGLMHVVYQLTFGAYRPTSSKRHAPRHLFFVETEPGIWSSVFKQLADLFSGNDFTPTISYADPASTLEDFEQLGSLPLIAYVPTMGSKLSKALDEHPVDLIGLADTSTATMTNGRIAATYVTPCDDSPVKNTRIADEDISRIREAFPSFLSFFVKNANIDAAYRSAQMPCIAAYNECCRLIGVEPRRTPLEIARTFFPGSGMTGVNTFFDMMHRQIQEDARPRICVVRGAPQDGYSFTKRGQHVFVMDDRVLLSHICVDVVNKVCLNDNKFSAEQLTQELKERGMLSEFPEGCRIDRNRCWCLSRETWEQDIVRPPINLTEKVGPSVVRLAPITGAEEAKEA